ncbi:MAG: GGDEF domain-containing protein [Fibrobacterota bacterium]
MVFDITTAALFTTITGIISALVMFIVWRINAEEKGPGLWCAAGILGAAAWIFPWLATSLGTPARVITNTLSTIGVYLILEGILQFRSIDAAPKRKILYGAAAGAVCIITIRTPDTARIRFLLMDPLIIIPLLLSAVVLLRHTTPIQKLVHGVTAGFFILLALFFAVRWSMALGGIPESENALLTIFNATLIMTVIWGMGWTYGLSLAVNLRSQEKIHHLALHDSLTGLPNRNSMYDFFALLEDNFARNHIPGFGIAFIDINGFKPLNDTYGHLFGDAVLQRFARILQDNVRHGDTVIRYGGDEFILLLNYISHREMLNDICERVAACIEKESQSIMKRNVFLSISLGHAFAPEDGVVIRELLQHADSRMYKNKREKRAVSRVVK